MKKGVPNPPGPPGLFGLVEAGDLQGQYNMGTKVPKLDLVKLFSLSEPRCILQPLLSSCNWWRFTNREKLGKSHGAGIPAKTNFMPAIKH